MESLQESLGMAPGKLAEIRALIQKYIDDGKVPGMVVMIAKGEQIIYNETFGENMREDSMMEIRSQTKSIVAAAFMTLVDEGKVSLSDPVCKYLPFFSKFVVFKALDGASGNLKTVPLESEITVQHLLTHTWGYPNAEDFVESSDKDMKYLDALAAKVGNPATNGGDWEKLTEVPLFCQPGKGFRYGLSTDVIGHLISTITGMPLDEFVRERIFAPLGMQDTYWKVPSEKAQRVTKTWEAVPALPLYGAWKSGLWMYGKNKGHTGSWLGWKISEMEKGGSNGTVRGGSGLLSTAADVMKFQMMLKRGGLTAPGGDVRVLSEDAVAAMTTDLLEVASSLGLDTFNSHAKDTATSAGQHPIFGAQAPGQGLGAGPLYVVCDPSTSRLAGGKGSYSSLGFNLTEWWNDPSNDLSVFYGTQLAPFYALPEFRQELAALIYGSMLPPAAAKFYKGELDANAAGGGAMGSMMNMMMYAMMFAPMARM
jgi:CubicO group peptidase (beta-lactamase class C family)